MRTERREARTLLCRMALISYGDVQRLGASRGGESDRAGPPGEATPMHDRWGARFDAAPDHALPDLIAQARAEFDAWIRRPFGTRTTETWDDLAARIVRDGWGIPPDECAIAMRCTSSMVRRARVAGHRDPERGQPLPEPNGDRMTWARELEAAGLSLRQIQSLTGIPKSTLGDRLGGSRRPVAR